MARIKPPIVFLGPSLSIEEAKKLLPNAEYRPPASRGDLYRERYLGASVLVLIDGVFMQRYSPSPREVVDVVRDGAFVLGAGSMGALRAAECWPVGMRGAGLIYRLFRAGVLQSDEDVAVTFDAQAGRVLSLALVNVRYAVHRAARTRMLSKAEATSVVRTAADIFYAERTWTRVYAALPFQLAPHLQKFLESIDLKEQDARLALDTVSRRLKEDPSFAERFRRRHETPFLFAEKEREPAADPLAGLDGAQVRRDLAIWLVTSGRFNRYVDAMLAAGPHLTAERTRLVGALVSNFDAFSENLWTMLASNGERDAELFRWQAFQHLAKDRPTPGPIDVYRSELELLANHGLRTWEELEKWADLQELPNEWFRETRDRMARARM